MGLSEGKRLFFLKLALFWVESNLNLSLYFSPSKSVTKRACPLNQCIATMKVVQEGECGLFKIKS